MIYISSDNTKSIKRKENAILRDQVNYDIVICDK